MSGCLKTSILGHCISEEEEEEEEGGVCEWMFENKYIRRGLEG